jgi:ubiquinone/menaquinone biosynthesis C-methylase UbiE
MLLLWALLIGGGLALVGWYLLVETEGVYLGQSVVIWLYDRFATRYDTVKAFDPVDEHRLLAVPLLAACSPHTDPLVLDIATGTARLPIALCAHPHFTGQVIAVDLSREMLAQAADNLAEDLARVDLIHAPAACLPFPDAAFDAVTLLEALEFTPSATATLTEALRVLRPGGVLLTTLRQNVRTMPGKLWSREQLTATLQRLDAEHITFHPWQHEYMKVWARKPGESAFIGATPLETVLRCPLCGAVGFAYDPPHFTCSACKTRIRVGPDGVIQMATVQRC